MDVPYDFCIIDDRNVKDFTMKTYSGYRKLDVVKKFGEAINKSSLEEACYWLIELHISGHLDLIWREIFNIMAENTNIINPNLLLWIWSKFKKYERLLDRFEKSHQYESRNNQEMRNLLIDVISVVTISDKSSILGKKRLPKVDQSHFSREYLRRKIISKNIFLIEDEMSREDDSEIRIAINEIATILRRHKGTIDDVLYWLIWMIKMEKFKKQNKIRFRCRTRTIDDIKEKFHQEWMWPLWRILFNEIKYRDDERLKRHIGVLYNIYKWKFTNGSKIRKHYIIMFAILLMKGDVMWESAIIKNSTIRIQACCNINYMYRLKKDENVTRMTKEKEVKLYSEKISMIKPVIEIKTQPVDKVKEFKIIIREEQERKESKIMEKMTFFNKLTFHSTDKHERAE